MASERGLIFSAPMVRTILAGTKVQTRRIVKPLPTVPLPAESGYVYEYDGAGFGGLVKHFPSGAMSCYPLPRCPYGVSGDRLWVRETWTAVDCMAGGSELDQPVAIGYRADHTAISYERDNVHRLDTYAWAWDTLKWKPAIHMPRWASRITLELTGVRVERLQDISQADARAEGLKAITKDGSTIKYGIPDRDGLPGTDDDGWSWALWDQDPRRAYRRLWEQINGHESWQANPWCWVLEFLRL